ncbi:hypothetical protein Pelo_16726 [Pelomyxa schiedti]|nr:hypothetical protein Pelo_16726 [Pelomyxa schiedti]
MDSRPVSHFGMEVLVSARDQFIALAAPSFCSSKMTDDDYHITDGVGAADPYQSSPSGPHHVRPITKTTYNGGASIWQRAGLPQHVVAEIGRRLHSLHELLRHDSLPRDGKHFLAGLLGDSVHVFMGVSPTMGVVRWRMCATRGESAGKVSVRGCLGPDRFMCMSDDGFRRRFFVADGFSLGSTTISCSDSSASAASGSDPSSSASSYYSGENTGPRASFPTLCVLNEMKPATPKVSGDCGRKSKNGSGLGCFFEVLRLKRLPYCNMKWVVVPGENELGAWRVVDGVMEFPSCCYLRDLGYKLRKAVFCSETGNIAIMSVKMDDESDSGGRVLFVDLELTYSQNRLAVVNEISTPCCNCMFLEPACFAVYWNKLHMSVKNTATGQIRTFEHVPLQYIIGPEHFCVAESSGMSVYHLSNLYTPIMTSLRACDAEPSRNKPLTGKTGIILVALTQTPAHNRNSTSSSHRQPHRVALIDVATGTRLAIITVPSRVITSKH